MDTSTALCNMANGLSDLELLKFLLALGVLLIVAKLLGQLVTYINMPVVAGELLAGIILGQSGLHYFAPAVSDFLFPSSGATPLALDIIKQIALVVVLFTTGLEMELFIIKKNIKESSTVGFFSIVIPLIVGFTFAYYFPQLLLGTAGSNLTSLLHFSAFIGISMSITALPVIAVILFNLELIQSKIGNIIISAAVINDLLGWIMFSILVEFVSGTGGLGHILQQSLFLICYIILALTIGSHVFSKIFDFIGRKLPMSDIILGVFLAICFLFAGFTTYLGMHSLVGAFITGVMLGNCKSINHNMKQTFIDVVSGLFSPLAFAIITLNVNFITNFNLTTTIVFLLLAISTKFTGVIYASRCINKFNMKDSFAIAAGMTARGAIEILLATRALHYQIINEQVFVSILFMALATSYLSAVGLNRYKLRSQ